MSNALIAALGGVSKALLARLMTVTMFGGYAFALSLLQYAGLVFEFGLFVPASRLAAKAEAAERRSVVGAVILTYAPVGAAFSLVVLGLSFAVDSMFRVHAGSELRSVAPLAFVFPLSFVSLQLVQGLGRLNLYSLTSLTTQAGFAAAVGLFVLFGLHLTADGALVLRAAAIGAGSVALLVLLRPVATGAWRHARSFVREARSYGFQVYLGRILSIGTYNMDVLMLGALTDPRTVAFYTLAGALASLISIPIAGLAAALYPRLVRQRGIESSWLIAAWAVGLGGAGVMVATAAWGIKVVFSSSYAGVVPYVLPLALAEATRGVTNIYNSYLAAQALGRQLRNAGLVLTTSNLALNLALIPAFGGLGAAWASFAALMLNLSAHVVAYRRSLRGLA